MCPLISECKSFKIAEIIDFYTCVVAERIILISDLILFIFGKYLDNIIACLMLFAVALEQKFALNHLFCMEVAKQRAKSCTLSPSLKICHMFNGDTNVEQKRENI